MKFSNKVIPYIIALAIFLLASIVYFHPVLDGKKLHQSDITQFTGMVKEINDFRADNNSEPYWTGASFSGMPAYQVSAYYPYDCVRIIDKAIARPVVIKPRIYLF